MAAPAGGRRPRLLVATDFSAGAERAVERAVRLPIVQTGDIEIAHVLTRGRHRRLAAATVDARRRLAAAAAAARRAADAAGHAPRIVTRLLLEHRASTAIVRHARAEGAELVVLGRRGAGHWRRLWIGSTAEQVVRLGVLPVLVVGSGAGHAYRRPLVAIDLTPEGRDTLAMALRLRDPASTALDVLYVDDTPFAGRLAAAMDRAAVQRHQRQVHRRAAAAVDARVRRWHPGGPELGWRILVRCGEPRSAILSQIGRLRSRLVVVGRQRRLGLMATLLGSVADAVVHLAPCDVLIVPSPHPAAAA